MQLVMSKARSASVAIQLFPAKLDSLSKYAPCKVSTPMLQLNVLNKRRENSPQSARSAPISLAVGMKRSTNYRQAAISLMDICNVPCTIHAPSSGVQDSSMIQMKVLMEISSLVPSSCLQIENLYILFILKSSKSVLETIYIWPAEMRTGCIF